MQICQLTLTRAAS